MSRISFILAVTLLLATGSLVFMTTFNRERNSENSSEADRSTIQISERFAHNSLSGKSRSRVISGREKDTRISLRQDDIASLTPGQLVRANRILSSTRQDARQTLDRYSRNYGLTKEQRREIFPFIVAHHENAHPAMTINGQPLAPITPGASLDESVASFLNSSQQEALAKDLSDHYAWWEDVVGQLEDNLDDAISNGEMIPVDENSPSLEMSTDTAAGSGEASGHSGGNLFDLLGR